jgi:hypothetical protein
MYITFDLIREEERIRDIEEAKMIIALVEE